MKLSFVTLIVVALFLSSCSNPVANSQVYVETETSPVDINISADKDGKVSVSGGLAPKFKVGLGAVDLKVGIQKTLELTSEKPYYLFVIWEDETGEIQREEYEISKGFHISFTQDELIQEIRGNNNSVIVVVKKPTVDSHPPEARGDIFGKVIDSQGHPVEGINIAIRQGNEDASSNGTFQRIDVYSQADGSFYTKLPPSTDPVWNVQIVGIDCTSHVMNVSNCNLTGYFEAIHDIHVKLPLSEPITLTFEKATTTIKGVVPANGMRIFAVRSDGASSWTESSPDGSFELPASDGSWEVYAANLDPYEEGEHVTLEIVNGKSDLITLKVP